MSQFQLLSSLPSIEATVPWYTESQDEPDSRGLSLIRGKSGVVTGVIDTNSGQIHLLIQDRLYKFLGFGDRADRVVPQISSSPSIEAETKFKSILEREGILIKRAGDHKFKTGPHAGKTVKTVFETDPEYFKKVSCYLYFEDTFLLRNSKDKVELMVESVLEAKEKILATALKTMEISNPDWWELFESKKSLPLLASRWTGLYTVSALVEHYYPEALNIAIDRPEDKLMCQRFIQEYRAWTL